MVEGLAKPCAIGGIVTCDLSAFGRDQLETRTRLFGNGRVVCGETVEQFVRVGIIVCVPETRIRL